VVARRHHYVPKCYLKSFAVENPVKKKPDVFVFDASSGKCFRTSTDNVALEKDFNTIDLEGHEPDAFEKAMASVENEIGPALTRIIEKRSLTDENDRILLLNLMGPLYIRNPRFREAKRSFHDRVQKMIMDVALSSKETWNSQIRQAKAAGFVAKDADADYDKIKKEYKPEDYRAEVPNEVHIVSEMDTFDHALPLLFERKWVLVKAPGGSPGFITCDHPVSLVWSEPQSKRLPLGLKTKGSEMFFPISPGLAVVGAYELENGEHEFNDEQVASSNGTTILNAERQVYPKGYDFKYQIDQKKDPRPGTSLIEDDQFKNNA
jgi:hypothetical protein